MCAAAALPMGLSHVILALPGLRSSAALPQNLHVAPSGWVAPKCSIALGLIFSLKLNPGSRQDRPQIQTSGSGHQSH